MHHIPPRIGYPCQGQDQEDRSPCFADIVISWASIDLPFDLASIAARSLFSDAYVPTCNRGREDGAGSLDLRKAEYS